MKTPHSKRGKDVIIHSPKPVPWVFQMSLIVSGISPGLIQCVKPMIADEKRNESAYAMIMMVGDMGSFVLLMMSSGVRC